MQTTNLSKKIQDMPIREDKLKQFTLDIFEEILKMSNENIKIKINKRFICNMKILDVLKNYICKYPDLRFGQALINLNIIESSDLFNEESMDTLKKLKNGMGN